MIRKIDLIRYLSGFDDDTPIMLGAHYDGYDELAKMNLKKLSYQGIHGESGEWEETEKVETETRKRGFLTCITLDI